MYLRNSWYVAGWSRDITDKPLARKILGEDLVIFRGADGALGALQDHCPHRHAPLSIGSVFGNDIRCGYHGMVFDRFGKCVHVPSQGAIPPRAKVTSYRVMERHGWIWVWMGDAVRANPDEIPDFSMLEDPDYRAVGTTNHIAASYRLVIDNLMDLSHAGFVHQSTIGTPEDTAKGRLTSHRTERGVQVRRLSQDVPAPPTYVRSGRLPPGIPIDRWQNIDFMAPGFVTIHVGGAEAGTGAIEGRYEHGLNLWVMNAITPETDNSSIYYWASVRNHAIDDAEADDLFFSQVSEAFEEDKRMLEAQQRVLGGRSDNWDIALKSDTGSIESRRVLDRLIINERKSLSAAA